MVGGGKYYIRIRDRFNTSITFTIINFLTCIIFIYSMIYSINKIINYFFGNMNGGNYKSSKIEEKQNKNDNNFYGNIFGENYESPKIKEKPSFPEFRNISNNKYTINEKESKDKILTSNFPNYINSINQYLKNINYDIIKIKTFTNINLNETNEKKNSK